MKFLLTTLISFIVCLTALAAPAPIGYTGRFTGNGGVTALSIGLTNLTTTTNVIYVELTGDDVAGDGSYAHPFKTIMRAASVTNSTSLNGMIVRLGPGAFNYVSLDKNGDFDQIDGIRVPRNGALIGSGKDLTTLTCSNWFDAIEFIVMQDNSTLADLTIDGWHTDGVGNGINVPIGEGDAFQLLNGVRGTNIFFNNVRVYGGPDCYINGGTGEVTNFIAFNCEFWSHFDCVAIRCTHFPMQAKFQNCFFWSDSVQGAAQFVGPQGNGTGTWTFVDCQFVDPNGNCTQVFSPANCTNQLYNCSVSSPNKQKVYTMGSGSSINTYGGNLETGGYSGSSVAGKFIEVAAKVIPQITLSTSFTNQIPRSSASVTNWVILSTNGIPLLVATNFNNTPAGQAFFVKVLVP